MKFRETTLNALFPERMLRDTPWRPEWDEQHRERLLRTTRLGAVLVGVVWLLHFPFFDVYFHKEPILFWLSIRVGLFAFSLCMVALSYWPRLARSRFYRLPMIVDSFAFCIIEAQAMNWTDKVYFVYPVIILMLCVLIIQANLFWSTVYALVLFAAQIPAFIRHGDSSREIMSGMALAITFICLYRSRFQDEVKTFLTGRLLAEAKEKVLVRELELTGAVQKLLLPPKNRIESDLFELAAKFVPAAYSAGDWWWYAHDGDKLRFIMGDVTGHGAGPAMVTAAVASQVKMSYDPARPFEELLHKTQANYSELFYGSDYWMTMTAAEIDLKTMRLSAWFAGGPPIFRLANGAKTETIQEAGPPLGSGPVHKFGFTELDLRAGDRLAIVSDGVYEERVQVSDKMIGVRKLNEWLKTFGEGSSIETTAQRLIEAVATQRGTLPQTDDYTIVIVDLKMAR